MIHILTQNHIRITSSTPSQRRRQTSDWNWKWKWKCESKIKMGPGSWRWSMKRKRKRDIPRMHFTEQVCVLLIDDIQTYTYTYCTYNFTSNVLHILCLATFMYPMAAARELLWMWRLLESMDMLVARILTQISLCITGSIRRKPNTLRLCKIMVYLLCQRFCRILDKSIRQFLT